MIDDRKIKDIEKADSIVIRISPSNKYDLLISDNNIKITRIWYQTITKSVFFLFGAIVLSSLFTSMWAVLVSGIIIIMLLYYKED